MDENLKTYLKWKEECAKKGKTPADMVTFSRSLGMPESYTIELQFIIEEMETKLAELVPAFGERGGGTTWITRSIPSGGLYTFWSGLIR